MAELDVTTFMSFLIVLVPVLLLRLSFSQMSVLDLTLPKAAAVASADVPEEDRVLELIVRQDKLEIYYPRGFLLKTIPQKNKTYDYKLLSEVLQEVKRLLKEQNIEKRDIMLLLEPNTDYQTIVSLMDSIRSYKTLIATSVVNAELFPDIALGDAPILSGMSDSPLSVPVSAAATATTLQVGGK